MAYIERDIVIAAPMDVIYTYAGSPQTIPEWYVGIVDVQADGVWPQVGGQARITYHIAGITLEVTATVLTYQPPYEFSFRMDGMVTGTSSWTYADEGGNTHVYVAFDYTLPGGVLGQMADKLVVDQLIASGEQSLANLKAICESG